MSTQKKKQKSQHSFYNEHKKEKSGRKIDLKGFWKSNKKYVKFSLYLFLATTTMWGCVNQIRISTSPNVSQGVEFYQTYDEVLPNLYQTQSSYTYSNPGDNEVLHQGSTSNTDTQTIEGLEDLHFYLINPAYNIGGNVEDENYDDRFLISATDAGKTYGKQLAYLDFYGFIPDIASIDWAAATETFTDSYWIVPNSTNLVPLHFRNDTDTVDRVSGWGDLMSNSDGTIKSDYSAFDPISGEYGWIWARDYSTGELSRDSVTNKLVVDNGNGYIAYKTDNLDAAYDPTKLVAIPYIGGSGDEGRSIVKYPTTQSTYNQFSEADEKLSFAINNVKFSINQYLFLNPDSFETPPVDNNWFNYTVTYTETDDDGVESEVTTTFSDMGWDAIKNDPDVEGEITKNQWDELAIYNVASLPHGFYSEPLSPDPINDIIDNGIQYIILPQQQGNPIFINNDDRLEMVDLRNDAISNINEVDSTNYAGWQDLETNSATQRWDPRVSNAGWAMVDLNGELIKVIDPDDPENEVALWALNKNVNKGHITNEMLVEHPELSWYVFDELQTNLRNGGYYVQEEYIIIINGYEAQAGTYLNDNDFMGLQEVGELGTWKGQSNYKDPEIQTAYLAPWISVHPEDRHSTEVTGDVIYLWEDEGSSRFTGTDEGVASTYWRLDDQVQGTEYEVDNQQFDDVAAGSLTTAAIVSSGQPGENGPRAIFASWGDWGIAWTAEFGPMYGLFVFPLAMVSTEVASWFPYSSFGGWGVLIGVFLIVFALRLLATLMSWKSTKSQSKLQELQTEVAEISAKYSKYDKKNKQMKQKKQQETMALYKKNEVNPLSSLGSIFITLPIFLSMWIIISALPIYKVASIGAFSFAVSPFYGMFQIGGSMFMIYLLLGMGIGLAQSISTKLPSWLADKRKGVTTLDDATKKARKKSNRTQNIMVGVFVFIGLTVPSLLGFYWMFSAIFTISLELLKHHLKVKKANKVREAKFKSASTNNSKKTKNPLNQGVTNSSKSTKPLKVNHKPSKSKKAQA